MCNRCSLCPPITFFKCVKFQMSTCSSLGPRVWDFLIETVKRCIIHHGTHYHLYHQKLSMNYCQEMIYKYSSSLIPWVE